MIGLSTQSIGYHVHLTLMVIKLHLRVINQLWLASLALVQNLLCVQVL